MGYALSVSLVIYISPEMESSALPESPRNLRSPLLIFLPCTPTPDLHNQTPERQLPDLHSLICIEFNLNKSKNSQVQSMADYSFGGTDEENAELKKLNAEVVCL